MSGGWSLADMPRQDGKLAVVTGATDGLGREVALALGASGAQVVIAGRNAARGEAVAREIGSGAHFERLDLADLTSVRDFAARVGAAHPAIDLLVANAGISMPPFEERTREGFELQMGGNYFGHFALAASLLPQLAAAHGRVVTVASIAAGHVKMDLDDLNAEKGYKPGLFYGRSKLAMLLFAQELQRRSDAAGWGITAVAAHPGFSRTNLGIAGPRVGKPKGFNFVGWSMAVLGPLIGQSAAGGSLPILYAATMPDIAGGGYFGPDGWAGLKGSPGQVKAPPKADADLARELWDRSLILTATDWSLPSSTEKG